MDTLLDAFTSAGAARNLVLEKAGLEETVFSNPDNRLSVETVTKAWVAARKITDNPLVGLQVGEHIRPGSFSVLGHLLMTSATLRDALDKAAQFALLVGDGGRLTVDMSNGNAVLIYDLVEKNIPCREQRIEAIIASLIGFSRSITGHEIVPLKVQFNHRPSGTLQAYKSFFKALPRFMAEDNSIVISESDLKLPLKQANPALSALLDDHAEKVLKQISRLPPFLMQLRQTMEAGLKEESLNLEGIARKLSMTSRSLQRKLSEMDTTYQAQLDQLRQDKAIEYLRDNQKSIGETSYMLGFSDTASFSRAFKKWTGQPPGKWLEEFANK